MNRMELANFLKKEGLSDSSLSFIPCNEKYCLIKNNSDWVIYFDERGQRTYEQSFATEDEACKKMLEFAALNQ